MKYYKIQIYKSVSQRGHLSITNHHSKHYKPQRGDLYIIERGFKLKTGIRTDLIVFDNYEFETDFNRRGHRVGRGVYEGGKLPERHCEGGTTAAISHQFRKQYKEM